MAGLPGFFAWGFVVAISFSLDSKPRLPGWAAFSSLPLVKQDQLPGKLVEGQCAQPDVCPLSQVKAGTTVCVRGLTAAPDVQDRLREIGFAVDQKIRLLTSQANVICQVCNARVAISQELAEAILVEPLSPASR